MNLATRLAAIGRSRRLLWIAVTIVVLVAAVAAAGRWILPGVLQSQIQKAGSAALHRMLTVEHVEVHPFQMKVALGGIKLMEADGQSVFASLQRIETQVSASSLLHLAPVIREIRIDGPYLHIRRLSDNRYNFDDIVAALAAAKPGEAKPKEGGPPPRFAVYNIQLDQGRIEFDDDPESAHHVVSDLKVGIPFISSLPSQEEVFVEPLLSAVVNGAPLVVKGKARPFAEPKEAVVNLDLDGVELPPYLKYLPFEPRFKLPSARLELHFEAGFKQPPGKAPAVSVSGRAALTSLLLTDLHDRTLLRLPALEVVLAPSDPLGGHLSVAKVALTGIELNAARDAKGAIDWMAIVPARDAKRAAATEPKAAAPAEPAAASPASTSPSLRVDVAEFAPKDAAVHWVDRDPSLPMEASVEHFNLRVAPIALDLAARKLAIGLVASDSAQLALLQGALAKPLAGGPAAAGAGGPAVAKSGRPAQVSAPVASAAPFEIAVDQVSVEHWGARIESRGLPQPAVTKVADLDLQVHGLSTAVGSTATLDLKAAVNRKGGIAIAGTVGARPLHADLKLDLNGVDLLPLQPYVTDRINILVTQANLGARGRLAVDQAADGSLKGGFRGDLKLGDLATIDKANGSDFLDWKSLHFDGVDLRLAPMALNIARVGLEEFFTRIIIDPTGRINLQDIARGSTPAPAPAASASEPAAPEAATATAAAEANEAAKDAGPETAAAPGAADDSASASAATAAVGASAQAARPMPPIRIGVVELKSGRARYTDNFIRPNYTANLVDLNGNVTGLSSQADSTAAVDIKGQVNSAPLVIAGQINPIKGDLFLDIKASVHGMELAPLSPYSGKYVGYGIERGKLSFEVAYKLEHRKLAAQNRLVLDQLTFGDKIESPTAIKLPVQLAVALLKDRNGVIDIDLPIGGSLDDPQFSVGGVIVKVLINLITKAITSPFALLGSLFGGGAELSHVAFDPGASAIGPSQEERLKALSKALAERPGLKLQIGAHVDPAADRAALSREALDRRLRAIKVKDLVAKGQSATLDTVTLAPEEVPALELRLYQQEHGAGQKDQGAKAPAPADIETSLLQSSAVGDDELIALADRRAQAVKAWLLTMGQVAEDRVFLVASHVDGAGEASGDEAGTKAAKDAPKGPRVDFSLK
jgi:uncharacterized protein involved in outer membrane biogenesis